MASPVPYIGRTRPTGSDQAVANGAVTVNRVALPDGVTATGRRRCKQAAASGVAASPVACIGIFQATKADGEVVEIANGYGCVLMGEAGAAVAADTDLTYDNTGRLVAAAPGSGNNAAIVGRSINAAGAAGDIFSFYYLPGIKQGQ
jgi:hypothetical protein